MGFLRISGVAPYMVALRSLHICTSKSESHFMDSYTCTIFINIVLKISKQKHCNKPIDIDVSVKMVEIVTSKKMLTFRVISGITFPENPPVSCKRISGFRCVWFKTSKFITIHCKLNPVVRGKRNSEQCNNYRPETYCEDQT